MRNQTLPGKTELFTRLTAFRIERKAITSIWAPLAMTAIALVLWFGSLSSMNLHQMNDLGLVSILPIPCFIALFVLICSFCFTLYGDLTRERETLLVVNVIVVITLLYGITSFVQEVPRFAVAYIHSGFTEFIMRTGTLATDVDARFSWPGFFTGNALLTQAAGLENSIAYAGWAPLVLNLLYLFPLVMIMQALTTDKKLIWASIWLFYVTNWIGQDYFSPQGLNIFLYLVILGIALRWFKGHDSVIVGLLDRVKIGGLPGKAVSWVREILVGHDTPDAPSGAFGRAGLILLIVVMFAAVASSHQLTPAALILGLGLLVVFGRCEIRSFPVLFGVITVGWISFMTVAYLSGHMEDVIGSIGRLWTSVNDNVTSRIKGSDEHQVVLSFRFAMTLAIWVLAFLGGVRGLFTRKLSLTSALLVCSPFPIMALNSYGGEALLRVYLFALPFTVFLAATLIYHTPEPRSSVFRPLALGVLSVTLLVGFMFARYGNERMDYMTKNEMDAFQYLYDTAAPGTHIVVASNNNPSRYRDIDKFDITPSQDALLDSPASVLQVMKTDPGVENYLLLSRSQQAYGELFNGKPIGWVDTLREALLATGEWTVVYQNDDAIILVLAEDAP